MNTITTQHGVPIVLNSNVDFTKYMSFLLILSQRCLEQLETDHVFNPLSLSCNLYPYLRMKGLFSRSYSSRSTRGQRREPNRPAEGSTSRQVRCTTVQGLKCSQKFNLNMDLFFFLFSYRFHMSGFSYLELSYHYLEILYQAKQACYT